MVIFIIVAVIIGVMWLYTAHLSPRARALKEARELFSPIEVGFSMEKFGCLCENLIIATPKSKRSGIEIHTYVGRCVGTTCSIRLSFSNFSYRNIRDMLPAYLYAQRLGWEDGDGLLCYESDGVQIASDYEAIKYGEALPEMSVAAYRALANEFQKYCPSVQQMGNDCVTAEGLFLKYKVID